MEWHHYRLKGERRGVAREILKGEEFPCAFCKGTGVVRKTSSQCPVCQGRGIVKVTPPAPWSVPIAGDEVTSLSAPILPAPYAVAKVLSVCTSL